MGSCFSCQLPSQIPTSQMPSCPLEKLLQDIIKWRKQEVFNLCDFSWADEQIETLVSYVSHVEVDPRFSSRMYEKLHLDQAWQERNIWRYRANKLVVRIMGDLGELFKVPTLQQLSHSHMDTTLKKDQLVAGFIKFLLHLLHSHQRFTALHKWPDVVNRVVKELRILITILGDRPFQAMENDQVQSSILEEFELVVNQAGALAHSLVFIPQLVLFPVVDVTKMNEALDALLESIQLLKTNITIYLQMLPNVAFTPSSNSSMDSPFVLVCLMHDLEDVMDLDDNTLLEVKDQSKTLHQWLLLCRSLFTGLEIEELKKEPVAVQIIAVAYDAKYLVSAFLDGEVPLWYLTMRLTHYINKIELDATMLQEMKQDCNLKASKLTGDFCTRLSPQAKKDYLADDIIVGFEQQEEHILDLLIRGTEELQEVFIYGMPGIGKTTLARSIYHHPLVSRHFDRRSWCVVSQMHNRKNLLIGILISIASDSLEEDTIMEMEEASLELKIYQILKYRRYLMVMDDLWDSEVWDNLRFLPNDRNGSRILFTSRNKDVAPSGGNGITKELPVLSNDQCWRLLEKKVFHNNPSPPQLLEVGRRIAAKCYGLPLVVVVVAGILSSMDMEESTWENMVQGLNHYMASDKSNSIMQILEVSYKHLPLHLKICFLYFRVFKEDEKIHVRKLLQLWIAEGFICKGENKRAECVAKEYLEELIDKNLVIVVERGSDGGPKLCVIHDLLHELCLKIAEKDTFLKLTNRDRIMWKKNGRWSHYTTHIYGSAVYGKPLYRASPNHLESSSSVRNRWMYSFSFYHTEVRARVFDGKPYFQYDEPGNEVMYPLRYLALPKMPMSLHKIVNLEFLTVTSAVGISSRILEMVKLKCIRAGQAYFQDDCDMLSRTSKIEYLSDVLISRRKDLKMLECLPNLHKLKCRYIPWHVDNGSLGCLDLQFHTQLECLKVSCLVGLNRIYDIKFPFNVGKLTLSAMEILPELMAIIGALPSLRVLKLQGRLGTTDALRQERWDTSDGEFKQLRIIKLRGLSLGQWNVPSSQHFPKLKQLTLDDCRWLIEIPPEIGEIETLQFIELRGECQKSLVDSAIQIGEEQTEMGNEEFRMDMQKLWIWYKGACMRTLRKGLYMSNVAPKEGFKNGRSFRRFRRNSSAMGRISSATVKSKRCRVFI